MNTGVAIIAADRFEYLQETLQSVMLNKSRPVHLFVDFVKSKQRQDELIKMSQNILGDRLVETIARPMNFGVGRNIIDARRHMFDTCGYEYALIMEDDLVVSSTYFDYVENMMRWAEDNYDNVGAVQGWTFCFEPTEQKQHLLPFVIDTLHNLWAYLLSRRCWNDIKPQMYYYEKTFLNRNYSDRIGFAIKNWYRKQISEIRLKGTRQYPLLFSWDKMQEYFKKTRTTGQDATTAMAMASNGWVRLAPIVNRARYIGKHGYHMDPVTYDRSRFGSMALDEYTTDATLTEFIPCK